MPFLPMSGRTDGPAVTFAPSDSGQRGAMPGYEPDIAELSARITDLSLSGSHPSLQVRAHDGMNWTVELGDRIQTQRAGLSDRLLAPGDQIKIRGHRASGFGDRRIRALRLTVAGRDYELAPEACLDA